MALVIGSGIFSLRDRLNDRGPVHTLQQKITPQIVERVQNEYEEEDPARKTSQDDGMHFQGR